MQRRKPSPLAMWLLPWLGLALLLASFPLAPKTASADPCGMVPPVYIGEGPPIKRIGVQKTYVFYKDGVETFLIRPGYEGKIEDFGMLIPFPSVPSIRKVPDEIFTHITAAIDPPEVVVDLRQRDYEFRRGTAGAPAMDRALEAEDGLGVNEVRVERQEAIGMYEVVVLRAGSAAALQRWMDEHGYVYPEGMDEACNDYIAEGWCFVAVKTRVAPKAAVDPRAGMDDIDPSLPDGASFDGHVQAMGFRFEVDELVVPMRLSSFNEGETHNVVYLLSDEPSAIDNMPQEFVRRQVSGEELYRNVTSPLPLRVIGGTIDDIPDNQWASIDAERDPAPHNGHARELFAFDLLSAITGDLIHAHEEQEKVLLEISERLQLRGTEIDQLHHIALAQMRAEVGERALTHLKGMTMTVIDGVFPREILANENLKFSSYELPKRANSMAEYHTWKVFDNGDAEVPGRMRGWGYGFGQPITVRPQPVGDGTLYHAEIPELVPDTIPVARPIAVVPERSTDVPPVATATGAGNGTNSTLWLALGIGTILAGIGVYFGVRLSRRKQAATAALLLALGGIVYLASTLDAQQPYDAEAEHIEALIEQFDERENADATLDELADIGEPAIDFLFGAAVESPSVVRRGWAIIALARIGGEQAQAYFAQLYDDEGQTLLVRTWALAAHIQHVVALDELVPLAQRSEQLIAARRPLAMRVMSLIDGDAEVADLLRLSQQVPQLSAALAQPILASGAGPIAVAMVTIPDDESSRQQAAGYLAAMAQQSQADRQAVSAALIDVFASDPEATDVPWAGGGMYLPHIGWNHVADDAKTLAKELLGWYVWCEIHERPAEQRKLHINLRSINFGRPAGYHQRANFSNQEPLEHYLELLGRPYGRKAIETILARYDSALLERYSDTLDKLSD